MIIAQIKGTAVDPTPALHRRQGEQAQSGRDRQQSATGEAAKYRGAQGLDPALIKELEKQFGFDKPLHERFFLMMGHYLTFDFGTSFFRDRRVVDLVIDKLPVSISLGLWTTLIIYLISIPLGIAKAVRDGSRFDVWTSAAIIVGYAIPSFLFAVLLVVLFAGGSFLQMFPLRGLTSDNCRHAVVVAAGPRLLLAHGAADHGDGDRQLRRPDDADQELVPRRDRQAIRRHRARQGPDRAPRALRPRVPQRDADRHRRLPRRSSSASCSPSTLLIEMIFSLDGLGLLGFEAAINRDYPVMFGTLYVFTLLGLLMRIVSDFTYTLIDPRIDFEARG